MPNTIKVILAKKETTYGTDSAPTPAANAVLTRNFSAKPIEADQLERPLDRGTWGANPTAATNKRQSHSFEVELAGSGTAGTAAAWHELLEACGMAPAAITAGVRAEQRMALPTATPSALTLHHYIEDQLRRAVGVRGTFSVDFTVGAYPFLSLSTVGLIPATTPRSTAAPTAPTLTRWRQPLEVSSVNTAILLDSYAVLLKSLRLDANVPASIRNLVGARYVNRGSHAVTGQLVVEAPSMAAKDYLATLDTNALVPLSIVHGTVAGNMVEVSCPKLQILDIAESEEDNRLMWTMQVAATVDAGADDLVLISR